MGNVKDAKERTVFEHGEERLFLSPAQAQRLLGISRAYLFLLLKRELLPRVKLGGRTLIPYDVLLRLREKALKEGTFVAKPRWWLEEGEENAFTNAYSSGDEKKRAKNEAG